MRVHPNIHSTGMWSVKHRGVRVRRMGKQDAKKAVAIAFKNRWGWLDRVAAQAGSTSVIAQFAAAVCISCWCVTSCSCA